MPSSTSTSLLHTPLYDLHKRLGARLVDFAGWEMPVQYAQTGIIAEHLAVRQRCGLFDLSHMGRLFVRGEEAVPLSQSCATRDLAKIRPGEAAYSLLCREDGGILDDVIVYVLGPEEVLWVVNASNRKKDLAWLQRQCEAQRLRAEIDDQTFETALIGVQGPESQAVLKHICAADLEMLTGYSFVRTQVLGREALVARTGYTGEDGFEVLAKAADAAATWNALLDDRSGATACGLGARDTLRTEAAMPLYGHEIDEATNPYEARLGWVVSLAKPQFIGREALAAIKQRGPDRKLVGLRVLEGGVPRPGYLIARNGQRVGVLTSGTFSPSLKESIALGYVPTGLSEVGEQFTVEIRGKASPAEVVPLPFVPHRTRTRAKN
jgi:aminomethyltransferase